MVEMINTAKLLFFIACLSLLTENSLLAANDNKTAATRGGIIKGTVKQLLPIDPSVGGQGMLGSLLVHEYGVDQQRRVVVHIMKTTKIFTITGAEIKKTAFSAIKAGDMIKVTISDGQMIMSYPVQVIAAEISIIK